MAMNRKLNISYYTAIKMLMELLANDKLLDDEDIKEMLKDMALQKGKTDTCFKEYGSGTDRIFCSGRRFAGLGERCDC